MLNAKDGPRKHVPIQRVRPRRPLQADNQDNRGEASWRAREKYQETVRIPEHLIFEKKNGGAMPPYEAIGRENNVFVFSAYAKGSGGTKSFGLWGRPDDTKKVKQAILAWISQVQSPHSPSRGVGTLISLRSMTAEVKEKQEKKWHREVQRHMYRQTPPEDMPFAAVGSFHWPVEEFQPTDFLGASLEALDPIRMSCSCYIIFDRSKQVLQAMSQSKKADVEKALIRIRLTYFQIVARQIFPLRSYYVSDVFGTSSQPTSDDICVLLRSVPYLPGNHEVGSGSSSEPSTYHTPYMMASPANKQLRTRDYQLSRTLKDALMPFIQKVRYYRGGLNLRIRLGTFVATQYQRRSSGWSLDEFETMLREPRFVGHVSQEISILQETIALPECLFSADQFLTPSDANAVNIAETRPTFDAEFDFISKDDGAICLHVSWCAIEDEYTSSVKYIRLPDKWTVHNKESAGPEALIDLSFINLVSPSAWQVAVQPYNVLDMSRVPKDLQTFAQTVDLDSTSLETWGSNRVRYNRHLTRHALAKLIQRRVFCYSVQASDYVLEIAQFHTQEWTLQGPSRARTSRTKPQWSLVVFRPEWDAMLAENEKLPIGRSVDWHGAENDWFPVSDARVEEMECQGFVELFQRLRKLESIITESQHGQQAQHAWGKRDDHEKGSGRPVSS